MSSFDFFKGFGVTFGTMFKKVVTEQYPEEFLPTAPRYHGRHQLNRHPDGLEKCVGCELCAWACPADAIFVEGGDNTEEARFSPGERYGADYQINYLRCIGCGLCIEACPTRSLTMINFYELADDDRQRLIYTKEDLLAPLLPGMEQPPHPMRLGDHEQDTTCRRRWSTPIRTSTTRLGNRFDEHSSGCAEFGVPAAASPGDGRLAHHRRCRWHRRDGGVLDPGPIALAGALGMVFSRNAVHSALWLVLTMLCLGALYMVQQAPFLGFVQIIVYTGAVMMLFLFVLMLVGRDSSDSVVEVLRGQRLAGALFGLGFVVLIVGALAKSLGQVRPAGPASVNNLPGGNVAGLGKLVFTTYLFPFELTSALLITAALGAMLLAFSQSRNAAKRGQRASVEARLRGDRVSPLPGPGVFATANSVATPALLPDGSIARDSLFANIESREVTEPHRPVEDAHALTGSRRHEADSERASASEEPKP